MVHSQASSPFLSLRDGSVGKMPSWALDGGRAGRLGEGQCLSRPEPRCPSEWRLSQGTSSQGHSRRVSFFPSSGAGEGKGGKMDSTSSWLWLP